MLTGPQFEALQWLERRACPTSKRQIYPYISGMVAKALYRREWARRQRGEVAITPRGRVALAEERLRREVARAD